jgi:hypothetical protein
MHLRQKGAAQESTTSCMPRCWQLLRLRTHLGTLQQALHHPAREASSRAPYQACNSPGCKHCVLGMQLSRLQTSPENRTACMPAPGAHLPMQCLSAQPQLSALQAARLKTAANAAPSPHPAQTSVWLHQPAAAGPLLQSTRQTSHQAGWGAHCLEPWRPPTGLAQHPGKHRSSQQPRAQNTARPCCAHDQ